MPINKQEMYLYLNIHVAIGPLIENENKTKLSRKQILRDEDISDAKGELYNRTV